MYLHSSRLVSSRLVQCIRKYLQIGKVKEELILLKLSWDSSKSVDMMTAVIASQSRPLLSSLVFGIDHLYSGVPSCQTPKNRTSYLMLQ